MGRALTTFDSIPNELRLRPRFAVIAGLGGLLLFTGMILSTAGPQAKVGELTLELLATNQRSGLEILNAVVNAIGLLALAATLIFLFGAVKARNPAVSGASRIVLIVGVVLAAIGGIAYGILITAKAHQFATHGLQTYPEANALLRHGPVAVLEYTGLLGPLLLAIGFGLVALNAMRVGLLTRSGGYIGIAAAVLSVVFNGTPPALLIEVFWLLSTAYLLSGRWPNGDPPAWRTGQAVPWPSSAELREQRLAARGRGRPASKRGEPAPVPARASARTTPSSTPTRSTGAKRKRKRRK